MSNDLVDICAYVGIIITHFMPKTFSSENRSFRERMRKNMVDRDRPLMTTIRRMRIAWWITKAVVTHSEYVILIVFPRQQWLRERAIALRYAYVSFFLVPACC
jgi:hypothetical protein